MNMSFTAMAPLLVALVVVVALALDVWLRLRRSSLGRPDDGRRAEALRKLATPPIPLNVARRVVPTRPQAPPVNRRYQAPPGTAEADARHRPRKRA